MDNPATNLQHIKSHDIKCGGILDQFGLTAIILKAKINSTSGLGNPSRR